MLPQFCIRNGHFSYVEADGDSIISTCPVSNIAFKLVIKKISNQITTISNECIIIVVVQGNIQYTVSYVPYYIFTVGTEDSD